MGDRHRFKLNLTAAGSGSAIEMDGAPLAGVRSLQVKCGPAHHATRVLVEFAACDVEIEADAELERVRSRRTAFSIGYEINRALVAERFAAGRT